MRISIKKFISLLLTITIIITNSFVICFAENLDNTVLNENDDIIWPYYNDEISSEAAIVMDADSSVILYEYNTEKKLYPASLAKIMTAIIVLERVGENYDDLVNFSYTSVTKDIDRKSVTIGASAGDQLSVKDCLYSLLLPSANDAANALAEYIAGSISDFALLMNEKAKNLGLTNTHFVNPSGLHNNDQYTTASDMAKILQCAIKFPMFLQISSSVSYRHAPIRKYKDPANSNNQVLNTNSIMVPGSGYYYNGITSGKTGHTELAGYNLASSAKKNNMHLICVTLGCKNDKKRFTETKSLFDFYFENYKSLTIKDTDKRFTESINTFAIDDVDLVKTLNITCNDDAHITLPKNADYNQVNSHLTYEVKDVYNKYAIGHITYLLNGKQVGSCNLEGRNIEIMDSIFTGHLNVSSNHLNESNGNANAPINKEHKTNLLIYKSSNGNLIFSNTLITFFILTFSFIVLIILILFVYIKFISNVNFPINKFLFKIRRTLRKLHK